MGELLGGGGFGNQQLNRQLREMLGGYGGLSGIRGTPGVSRVQQPAPAQGPGGEPGGFTAGAMTRRRLDGDGGGSPGMGGKGPGSQLPSFLGPNVASLFQGLGRVNQPTPIDFRGLLAQAIPGISFPVAPFGGGDKGLGGLPGLGGGPRGSQGSPAGGRGGPGNTGLRSPEGGWIAR